MLHRVQFYVSDLFGAMSAIYLSLLIKIAPLFLSAAAATNVKTWKYNTDIFDPQNWVDGKPAHDCKGLIFDRDSPAPVVIEKLYTEQIILPEFGSLFIADGGFIEFNKNEKCIKLKPMEWHDFDSPKSWLSEDNIAVPDQEKLPCIYDKIVFPKGVHSAARLLYIETAPVVVSGFQFGHQELDNAQISYFLRSDVGTELFYNGDHYGITKDPNACANTKAGCVCDPYHTLNCPYESVEVMCEDPIVPIGSCTPICGAYLTFDTNERFDINKIRRKLERDYPNVYTHISRVKTMSGTTIQVVFAEEYYEGNSVSYAEDFFQEMSSGARQYGLTNIAKPISAGRIKIKDQAVKSLLFGIFATLFFVMVIFAAIFYFSGDMPINFGGISRFVPRSRPLSAAAPAFFARFTNDDDQGGLIIREESPTGSVLSLAQSFDNPMYGAGEAVKSHPEEDSAKTRDENGAQTLDRSSPKVMNGDRMKDEVKVKKLDEARARKLDEGRAKKLGQVTMKKLDEVNAKVLDLDSAKVLDLDSAKVLDSAKLVDVESAKLVDVDNAKLVDVDSAKLVDMDRETARGESKFFKEPSTMQEMREVLNDNLQKLEQTLEKTAQSEKKLEVHSAENPLFDISDGQGHVTKGSL